MIGGIGERKEKENEALHMLLEGGEKNRRNHRQDHEPMKFSSGFRCFTLLELALALALFLVTFVTFAFAPVFVTLCKCLRSKDFRGERGVLQLFMHARRRDLHCRFYC